MAQLFTATRTGYRIPVQLVTPYHIPRSMGDSTVLQRLQPVTTPAEPIDISDSDTEAPIAGPSNGGVINID